VPLAHIIWQGVAATVSRSGTTQVAVVQADDDCRTLATVNLA
jgi:hypothetical protein